MSKRDLRSNNKRKLDKRAKGRASKVANRPPQPDPVRDIALTNPEGVRAVAGEQWDAAANGPLGGALIPQFQEVLWRTARKLNTNPSSPGFSGLVETVWAEKRREVEGNIGGKPVARDLNAPLSYTVVIAGHPYAEGVELKVDHGALSKPDALALLDRARDELSRAPKLALKAGVFYRSRDGARWCCFDTGKALARCVRVADGRIEHFYIDGRYDKAGEREHTLLEECT